ncbi:Alkaline ceramidase [Phaffia rhodozyma]|uniref:Alkaline ceramidase n=1 Tax=Phaffia rhodozyma TaxID=264483 RepID=A0A0F7SFM3_PHARH|nr:Alkaline ceramidase [Phaffia rhodozyma]
MGVTRTGQLASGIWGDHSALIDWCEQNYHVTRYIAEFTNTLSKFVFNPFRYLTPSFDPLTAFDLKPKDLLTIWSLFGSFFCSRSCFQHNSIPFVSMAAYGFVHVLKQGMAPRLSLAYAGMGLVGVGSFLFHATLKWEFQLADELPMIWFSSYLLWSLFNSNPGYDMSVNAWLGLGSLITVDLALSLLYMAYPNPLCHQALFACILLASLKRTNHLVGNVLPEQHRSTVNRLYLTGAASFLAGFLLWNVDNEMCDSIENIRKVWGWWGYGLILEGHAWWHLLTGVGTYRMVTASILLLATIKSTDPSERFEVVDTFGGLLPYVRRVSADKTK